MSVLSRLRGFIGRGDGNPPVAKDPRFATAPAFVPAPELVRLLADLERPVGAEEMPRRVEVCRAALSLITVGAPPLLVATLHSELASSLAQSPARNLAANQEEAIQCYGRALTVLRRETFPVQWAMVQHNLGNLYADRIHDDRAANQETARQCYEQVLAVLTRESVPAEWAKTQHSLGDLYGERLLGTPTANLEEAIGHYEQALAVRTSERLPVQWAATQLHLGNVYRKRIQGDPAGNQERAIGCFTDALKVHTREAFPIEWAAIQHELGTVYAIRIRYEREVNQEMAIACFQQALSVRTQDALPIQWAATQGNLGIAYASRIKGEPADNQEAALACIQRTLTVFTRDQYPVQWAMAQGQLGQFYKNRIRGEPAANREAAISCFEQALTVFRKESFPADWANAQRGLGDAYFGRGRGDPSKNQERAIGCYESALTVLDRTTAPSEWALTLGKLGDAYHLRIEADRADNLEKSIGYHKLALSVLSRDTYPELWAGTQNDLGNVYQMRLAGDPAENQEAAIAAFQRALAVFTREAFPADWAGTKHNLGIVFAGRLLGKPEANQEQAIDCFRQALTVYTKATWSQRCRTVAFTLGRLLHEFRRFPEARDALETAHEAVEAMRDEIVRHEAKQALAAENAELYALLVHACLVLGDIEAAFRFAVVGKGRAFIDLLASARVDLAAAGADDPELAENLARARHLRERIDALIRRLDSPSDPGNDRSTVYISGPLLRELSALRAELAALWDEISFHHAALFATVQAPALTVEDARALAGNVGATLVEYVRHVGGWGAFVVTSHAVQYVPLSFDEAALQRKTSAWLLAIATPLGQGELSMRTLDAWYDALIAPLRPYFVEGTLVFAPASWLHTVPLAAARDQITARHLCEDYVLAFAPSLGALRVVHDQAGRAAVNAETEDRLLSVAYPGDPQSEAHLSQVIPEAETVAQHFSRVTRLYDASATPDAVLLAAGMEAPTVVHFGCHGSVVPERPEESGLWLAAGVLPVQRVATELRLARTRLATIAACLVGRVAVRQGEEHVGLVQALLTAGARAVVAALWAVNDHSTRVLFEAFYGAVAKGCSPARALAEATRQVRMRPEWTHPFHWAAFQANGLSFGPTDADASCLAPNARESMNALVEAVTRGGIALSSTHVVDDARALLMQLSAHATVVSTALASEEQERLADELTAFAAEAQVVQTERELMTIADRFIRSIEAIPVLRQLIFPGHFDVPAERKTREWTLAHHHSTAPDDQRAQTLGPVVSNEVVEFRDLLLSLTTGPESDDKRSERQPDG